MLKRVCERFKLHLGGGDESISNHTLYLFMGHLTEYFKALDKLDNQGIPPQLIELLVREGVEDKKFLQDQKSMEQLVQVIQRNGFEAGSPVWREEREVFEIMVHMPEPTGVYIHPVKIGRGLIYSAEYQKCVTNEKGIRAYDKPPFTIVTTDKDMIGATYEDKRSLLKYLTEEAKKNIQVQRYKGLGEMNPAQLWETTMNPAKRMLLQVKVEDAVESDEIFTILMGDEVEPRREFIQNNALEVSMLDI